MRTGRNFGGGKPGRAIHGALIGLKQNGVVDRLRDGRWVLKELVQRLRTNEAITNAEVVKR